MVEVGSMVVVVSRGSRSEGDGGVWGWCSFLGWFVSHGSHCGSVNSLNIFTDTFTKDTEQIEEIFKAIANYLSNIKKSNSCSMGGGS